MPSHDFDAGNYPMTLPTNARLRAMVVPPAVAPKPQPTKSASGQPNIPLPFIPTTGSNRGGIKSGALRSVSQSSNGSQRRSHSRSPSLDFPSGPTAADLKLQEENAELKRRLEEKTELLDAAFAVIAELQTETELLRSRVTRLASEMDGLVESEFEPEPDPAQEEHLDGAVNPEEPETVLEEQFVIEENGWQQDFEPFEAETELLPEEPPISVPEEPEVGSEPLSDQYEPLQDVEISLVMEPSMVVEEPDQAEPEPEPASAEPPQSPPSSSSASVTDQVFFTMTSPKMEHAPAVHLAEQVEVIEPEVEDGGESSELPLTASELRYPGDEPSEPEPQENGGSAGLEMVVTFDDAMLADLEPLEALAELEPKPEEHQQQPEQIEAVPPADPPEWNPNNFLDIQPEHLVDESFEDAPSQADMTTLDALDNIFMHGIAPPEEYEDSDHSFANTTGGWDGYATAPMIPFDRLPSLPDSLPDEMLPDVPDFEPVSREMSREVSPVNSPKKMAIAEAARTMLEMPEDEEPEFQPTREAEEVLEPPIEDQPEEQPERPKTPEVEPQPSAYTTRMPVPLLDQNFDREEDRATSSPSPTKSQSPGKKRASTIVGKIVNRHRRRTMVPSELPAARPSTTDEDTF